MVDYNEIYGVSSSGAVIGAIILLIVVLNSVDGTLDLAAKFLRWYRDKHWNNNSLSDKLGGLFISAVIIAVLWGVLQEMFSS